MFRAAFIPVIVISLVCSGHYAIFKLLHLCFKIEKVWISIVSGVLLAILALSFLPAAILVRHFRSPLNQWIFIGAGLWLGFFINLMISLALGGTVAFVISRFSDISKYALALGASWFIVALLATCIGVYKAQFPEVRYIPLSLPETPQWWKGKTIVQLSDIHLGAVNGTSFMNRLAEKVNALSPDVIVITGDLFDGLGGDIEELIQSVNTLKATKGVLVISGNHEGYNGRRIDIDSLMKKMSGRIINNEIIEIEGIHFIGVKYPGFTGRDEYSKKFIDTIKKTASANGPSILLFHTPTDIIANYKNHAEQQLKTYWHPDTSCSFNKSLGINLQLSGHTHAGQFHPFVWLTRYIYSGRHYGLFKDGDFQLYVSSGTGTFGPPIRSGCPSEIVVFSLQ